MHISTGFPRLIGKGQRGFWEVTAIHQDGRIHSVVYIAFTMCEAQHRYLMEFGPVHGKINVKFIRRTP